MPNKHVDSQNFAPHEKKRLDQLLVDRALFTSREKAQAEILLGNILVNGIRETKPGKGVKSDSRIEILEKECPYVSRGALKLKGALEDFGLSVNGKQCCDLGASTGGFTEILLLNGASSVYAIDVGYGQLDWKLRQDPRVKVFERTNVRYLKEDTLKTTFDFVCGDLSFISLKWILPVVSMLMRDNASSIMLIKPQFELEPEKNVKGIVKTPQYHEEAIRLVIEYADNAGLSTVMLAFSHIRGAKGNIEYVILLRKGEIYEEKIVAPNIHDTVEQAANFFKKSREVDQD
jgi:23S rRNA (cytidine1920-2'-O)/16S rRNA (cytidine1409-2'-O)-methyltransferase